MSTQLFLLKGMIRRKLISRNRYSGEKLVDLIYNRLLNFDKQTGWLTEDNVERMAKIRQRLDFYLEQEN